MVAAEGEEDVQLALVVRFFVEPSL